MLDASLPLTVGEFEEWGNPKNEAEYRYMHAATARTTTSARRPTRRCWSRPRTTTARSCTGSRPSTWPSCARTKTDNNPLLFFINMQAGHGGASGRYDQLRERAFDFAFVLTQLGIAKGP